MWSKRDLRHPNCRDVDEALHILLDLMVHTDVVGNGRKLRKHCECPYLNTAFIYVTSRELLSLLVRREGAVDRAQLVPLRIRNDSTRNVRRSLCKYDCTGTLSDVCCSWGNASCPTYHQGLHPGANLPGKKKEVSKFEID